MSSVNRRRFVLVSLVVGLGMLFSLSQGVAAQSPNLEQIALKLVAESNGLSSDGLSSGGLVVVNSAPAEYPLLGKTAFDFKVMDNRSGAIYSVTLDKDGQKLDAAQLTADEQAAYVAKYGRLEPELAGQLAGASVNVADSKPIEVIIWLKEPLYAGPQRPALDDNKALATEGKQIAFFAQVDVQRAAAVTAVVAPAADKLTKLGYKVATDQYAPVLYAALTPQAIKEVAGWDEVDQVYLSRINQPALEIARSTIGADAVNGRGITGSGIKVAQIEVGGRIATSNPYLSGVTQDTSYVCGSASSHSTAVAGIIRSTNTSRRGIASGVSLWAGGSCNGIDSEIQNRSTAAMNWGARALNLSFQKDISLIPGANDRFYDSMVINNYRTIVSAAGNNGSGNGNVASPGLAYNVITVGNFDDKNTVGWSGDTMDSTSSWRDPISTHSDREKPEVAAPGANINSTTTSSPWTGATGSGTSYAAPMVTGVSALLIQRNSGLSAWPEAIKAILMATAVHNIEGATRLSEYDGAGGIVADRADDVARSVDGIWGAQGYSCSTAASLDATTMYLYGGTRTRVVITWDNNPSYSSYASKPSADLDLQVVNSSGSVVASSVSWDNTYEIVDFTPSSTGNYKLRVTRIRCDYSPSFLGWAWRRGN
jgi:hypothetical protein